MTVLIAVISGVYGLVIGSFLNVVIWRVPRHESLVAPRSHCPECDTPIAPRDNIPLVSWALLRGRCRHCRAPISSRYPFVELATAVLFAAVGARFAHSWALPAFLVLTAALIAISAIDLEHFIIPNRIVYPVGFASVILLAAAAAIEHEWKPSKASLLDGQLAGVRVLRGRAQRRSLRRDGLRRRAPVGRSGPVPRLVGLAPGVRRPVRRVPARGRDRHVADRVRAPRGRKQHIPFGPFLAAGTMTFVLVGDQIVSWWRGLGH